MADSDRRTRRARAIRNAVLLGLTAVGIYALYIFLVYRAGPGAG